MLPGNQYALQNNIFNDRSILSEDDINLLVTQLNVVNPTSDTNVANKQYVDDAIEAAESGISGGSLTSLTVNGVITSVHNSFGFDAGFSAVCPDVAEECSIGFFKNADKSLVDDGDCFILGRNVFSVTQDAFGLGMSGTNGGIILKVDTDKNTTLTNKLYILGTEESTSSSTGAVQIAGGCAVSKDLYCAQDVTVVGDIASNTMTNNKLMTIGTGNFNQYMVYTQGNLLSVGHGLTYNETATPTDLTNSQYISSEFASYTLNSVSINTTITDVYNVYIGGALTHGVNNTLTNSYALCVQSGVSIFRDTTDSTSNSSGAMIFSGGVGIGKSANIGGKLKVRTQNITETAKSNGIFMEVGGGDYTDSGTASGGNITNIVGSYFQAPTIKATNTGVTVSMAETLYVEGPPNASTNVTINDKYAMTIGSGRVMFPQEIVTGRYNLASIIQHYSYTSSYIITCSTSGKVKVNSQTGQALDLCINDVAKLRVNSTGTVSINDTTESTSPTSGSLQVGGGIGCAKSIQTTGNIVSKLDGGFYNSQFKAVPSVDGYEASIALYNKADLTATSAGDVYILGQNSWGNGASTFSIGTPVVGSIYKVTATNQNSFTGQVGICTSNISLPQQNYGSMFNVGTDGRVITNTSIAATGNWNSFYGAYFAKPVLAATNTGITCSLAYNTYIGPAPTTGTNVTSISNSFSLGISEDMHCLGKIYGGNYAMPMYVANQNVRPGISTDFALFQSGNGDTVVNSKSGQPLQFKINNVLGAQLTSSNLFEVSSTTDSTSSTSGALTVVGGAGVAKSLFVGNDLTVDGEFFTNSVINVRASNSGGPVTNTIQNTASSAIYNESRFFLKTNSDNLCGAYLSVAEGNGSTYPTYSVSDKESVFSISISTSADNSTVAEAFSLTDQYCFVRNLIPYGGTNAYDLGSSNAGKSWNNIYSVNAVTVTSDQNLKTAFGEINPQESEYIIRNVKPISFNWDKQVVPTADNNRHVGFIAQEMEDVLRYTSLKDTIVH